ncbi:MAG: radical SAM protein, partial [Eubacterium sp.]|nr:radical SAM protein [Eubacterium sp.]
MAKISPKLLRFFGDKLLDYTYKNPERNMLRIMKIVKKAVGGMYPETTFTKPVEIITDESNIWHGYVFNGLEDIDRRQFKNIALTFAIDAGYVGTSTLRQKREELHCNIPWVILLDPTSACNLKCKGCWAAEYGHKSNLSLDEMRKLIREAKELGTHFFMFTGGEPLVRKEDVLTLVRENRDCLFLCFTNGTLIDDKFCEDMKEAGNLTLALSIEGNKETTDARRGEDTYDKVIEAMRLLKKHKCLFGTSVCYTSQNYKAVTSDEFYDTEIENGAKFAWYFHYMPVGADADTSLLLTPEQREYVYRAIREKRNSKTGKPIFTVDFQNDGEFVGGCIAGGRNY